MNHRSPETQRKGRCGMTTDEKLAELRERYSDWRISKADEEGHFELTPGVFVVTPIGHYVAFTPIDGWDARRLIAMESLAALAEALAKLEGVTVPRELGTVQDIVAAWLRATDHEGLCAFQCGCDLEHFMPCGEDCSACVPGHKVAVDPKESEWDRGWAIAPGPRMYVSEPQSERGE